MNYYKLISGENFIGIATQRDFLTYQKKHSILLACDEENAQYVQCSDTYYRSDWMVPVKTDTISYNTVEVIKIEKEEYDILLAAVEAGEEVQIEQEQHTEDDVPTVDTETETTIEYVRNMKVLEMSNTCNNAITSGFDVQLSDGNTYHFSLTTQDQLNLITLSTMVATGETAIPYHADGELCKFYSVQDITTIVSAATAYKTYHVSYFNALKAYIESMDDIMSIGDVNYGTEIPEAYQSDVLKTIISQSGSGE